MKADPFKVVDVLHSTKQRFVVPLYQRQYQWHDHKNYGARNSAFWLDVVAKATNLITESPQFDHYMGALLLAPDGSDDEFDKTKVMHVVDGQQRLTTFLIFLAAIREVAHDYSLTELAEQIKKYLFNETGSADTDPLAKYKLIPTPIDRTVFFDILDKSYSDIRENYRREYRGKGNSIPQSTNVPALRAYEYFYVQISDFVASGFSDDTEIDINEENVQVENMPNASEEHARNRILVILEALVFHLKLMVITLGDDDDAQVIFETLNSKGQPLRAMDLVRNNIFYRAEKQFHSEEDARKKAEQLYHEIWMPFDERWWGDNAPNARPARPRIDHFLANLLTAETGKRITVRELYAEYRAWATPNQQPLFPDVKDELAVLQRHKPTYETLEKRQEGEGGEAIAWLGDRLRAWQNTTAYPIAFQIADKKVNNETRWKVAQAINSYLVRRALCDLTSKNLNQVFPRLAGEFCRHGVSIESVRKFFNKEQSRDTTRFPDDKELISGILEKQAYYNIPSRILVNMLWSFELASRTKKTEETGPPDFLWIEHVMPQSWGENYPINGKKMSEIDTDNPDDLANYIERERIIHTLGNLTITRDRLNISMQNAAFPEKREQLVEHSNLSLNKNIAKEKEWDEETIKKRSEALAELAINIWPSLDKL